MRNLSTMRGAAIAALVMIGCGGDDSNNPADARVDAIPMWDAPPDGPGQPRLITYNVLTFEGVPEIGGDTVLISDNGGAWQPMAENAGVFTAMVVGPRYAIARGCSDPPIQYSEAWLYYLHVDDATTLTDIGCHESGLGVPVTGALAGVAANQRGFIGFGPIASFVSAGATDYSVAIPPGTVDIVGRLFANVSATMPRPTQRLYVERDVAITPDLVHDIDFATDGFDPEEHTIDITGAGAAASESVVVRLLGADQLLGFSIESTRGVTNRYHAVPAARMRANELVYVARTSSDPGSSRSFATVLAAPGAITGAYGPAYTAAAPTFEATAPVRLAGTLPNVADADLYEVFAQVVDPVTFDFWFWSQTYSARWAGGQAIDFTFPDLAGIGGWDIALPAGQPVDWNQSVRTSTLATLLPGYGVPQLENDVQTSAATSGQLVPP